MRRKLRHIWHKLFYMLTPSAMHRFGMTCKEAVAQIDVEDANLVARFRLRLHLSFCQACSNYHRTSNVLGNTIRKLMKGSKTFDLEKINHELLQKFTRTSDESND